jgi:UDP-3-O-[3-hydroxymyristoyl] N-acetylglucosamine deacetylase
MLLQKTIKSSIEVEGVGLHTGQRCRIVFRPAMPNTGLVFLRSEQGLRSSESCLSSHSGIAIQDSIQASGQTSFQISGGPSFLKVHSHQVVDTRLATTLGVGDFRISTVEHCLCAMAALRLDNLIIELEGPEIPIRDGSSLHFLEALQKVGLIEQSMPRQYWVIHQPIRVSQGDKWAEALPYHGLRLSVGIEFDHPVIGYQHIDIDINETSFASELARARTFGFLKDVEYLQSQGLAKGGSLDNAIVLDHEKVLNPEGLRWPDEFVRHKALDALGDLTLLGYPLIGHIRFFKAGHDLLHQLVCQIRESSSHSRLQAMTFDVSGV